jgi:putative ABC transport system permease protein
MPTPAANATVPSARQIQQNIESLGTNTLTVFSGQFGPGAGTAGELRSQNQNLTVEVARALADQDAAPHVTSVSPEVTTQVTATYEGASHDVSELVGTYPSYFEASNSPIGDGTYFTNDDVLTARKVVVLGESVAEDLFGDVDPIGKRVSYSFGGGFQFNPAWLTLVGVVADARVTSVDETGKHVLYLPEAQSFPAQAVLVRTAGDPRPVTPQVIETLRALDPARPLEHVFTLAELRDESLAPQRLNATLFVIFAALALFIAAVGVAAVLAFTVSTRRRELGIRAALGAVPLRLLGMVLRDGGIMATVGLLLGAAGSIVLTRFLQGQLYEVRPLDAATFVAVGAVLLAVALIAALVPARRATKTAPVEVLRAD